MTARGLAHLPVVTLLFAAAAAAAPPCVTIQSPSRCEGPGFLCDAILTLPPNCASPAIFNLLGTPPVSYTLSGTSTLDLAFACAGSDPMAFTYLLSCGPVAACSSQGSVSFGASRGACLSVTACPATCAGAQGQQCSYNVTLTVTQGLGFPDVATITVPPGDTVTPASFTVLPGVATPVNVTLFAPCGTSAVALGVHLSFPPPSGGTGTGPAVSQSVNVPLPTCVCGTKYDDLNVNGQQDLGEPPLPGWTIYADLNNNGTLDGGEPSAVTDAGGHYCLALPPGGPYTIREVLAPGWTTTQPAGGFYSTVASSSQLNFGNWQCKLATGAGSGSAPLCKGQSTTVFLQPPVPPGPINWYALANCGTTPPPCGTGAWTPLTSPPGTGGQDWPTLALLGTTCYCATVGGLSGCPNLASSVFDVAVVQPPPPPTISCNKVGDGACQSQMCGPLQVSLTANGACPTAWVNPPSSSGTITQSVAAGLCSSAPFLFKAESTCAACPPSDAVVALDIFGPAAGTLTVQTPQICAGKDDDVVTLSGPAPGCPQIEWFSGTSAGLINNFLAQGNTLWNTNHLPPGDTWYQVHVGNPPCSTVLTSAVVIHALTQPAVSISASGPTSFCEPGSVLLTATPLITSTSASSTGFQWYRNGIAVGSGTTFTASQSGYYWVIDSTQCGSSTSNVIHVVVSDPVAAILGPCGLCNGLCVNLTGIAAGGVAPYTFQWSPPPTSGSGASANFCSPGTYLLTVTDALGCKATDSHPVGLCPIC
jgi:hypothetical protein